MSEIKKDLFREFREEETIQIEDAVEQNVSELFKVVGTSPENIEKLDAVPFSYWKITFKALFKKPFVIVSIVMILLVVFFTVFGPLINFYPPVTGHGVNAIQGEKFGS